MKKLTPEEREATQELRLQRIRDAKKRYIENHPDRRKESYNNYWKKKRAENPEMWKKEMRTRAKLHRMNHLNDYQKMEKHKSRIVREKTQNLIPVKWLTEEQYNQIIIKQEGKCAICSLIFAKSHIKPVEDHDHNTGKVRGILCQKCNMDLGFIEKGTKTKFKHFEEAMIYLQALRD